MTKIYERVKINAICKNEIQNLFLKKRLSVQVIITGHY